MTGFTEEQKLQDRVDFPTEYMNYIHGLSHPDFTSTISVQIPSFCDPMLLSTIESFRTQAANPDRVHFAVCYQDDDMETLEKLKAIPNCAVKHIPKIEAPGLCAARYECHQLMTDEDFTLHSDSHMRAAKYWDIALIEQWKSIGDEKAIVSGYPHDFSKHYDKPVDDKVFTKIRFDGICASTVKNVEPDGNIRFRGKRIQADGPFMRGLFISGGCVFGPAILDREVPSDPYCYFVADEICLDIRYYTHGYKVYHPKYIPIWHLYNRAAVQTDKKIERFNVADNTMSQRRVDERKRMRTVYGLLSAGVDLGEFGNGTEKTVAEFEADAGLAFKFHAVRKFAINGKFFASDLTEDDKKWVCFLPDESEHVCRELPDVTVLAKKYGKKTICVQIPSYRDASLRQTIKSLLYQADRKDRIHFAICIQDDRNDIASILRQIPNIKVTVLSKDEMKGTGLARKKCQELYDGEDYVLITDAHMLAIWHWDTMLIDQFEKLGNQKSVITGYPPDYQSARGQALWDGTMDVPARLRTFGIGSFLDSYNSSQNLLYANAYPANWLDDAYKASEEYDICRKNTGIGAAYLFTAGQFNADVGFSESAMYRGDECMTTMVAYTKGYDIVTYRNAYLRHDTLGATKRAHNTMHASEYDKMKLEQQEFYDLLMTGRCSDLELGTERSVDDYFRYTGVDFKNGIIYSRAFMKEPGTDDANVETVGCKAFRLDDERIRKTKIHIFAVFGKDCKTTPDEFEKNAKQAAYRPENIVVMPCVINDDLPFGHHFNKVFSDRKMADKDIMLIVDESVRFIYGWDHDMLRCMTKLGKGTVFSTATSLLNDTYVDKAYVNPQVEITYDTINSKFAWKYVTGPLKNVRPFICDGIVGMLAGDYRKVRLPGQMSYADYMTFYSVMLYTHGYDVRYNDYSYLYRSYCPEKIDDAAEVDETLAKTIFANPTLLPDDALVYKYGNGKERSVFDWFREFGLHYLHSSAKVVKM